MALTASEARQVVERRVLGEKGQQVSKMSVFDVVVENRAN